MAAVLVRGSSGQWFEDPRLTFQNMTFDMVNRASYNTSDCLYDMLQCWEAVKYLNCLIITTCTSWSRDRAPAEPKPLK